MTFYYQAFNKKGETVADFLEATSEQSARQKIKTMELYVVSLKKHEVVKNEISKEKEENKFQQLFEKVTYQINIKLASKNVGIFSRQLATLLKAGLPLTTAIGDIVDQIENDHFKNIVADIKSKIEEGSTFSNALDRHKNIFSEMYINMVRVGENLGSLDTVIVRLSEIEEKKNILKSKIKSALWYPTFMFIFAILVVIFLLVTVVPSITEMFLEQGAELPLPTVIVIGISDFLAMFWWLIPILIGTISYFYKKYSETLNGRLKIDEIKFKIPIIKGFYVKLITLKFVSNLAVLLTNKVDLIKSLEIVKKLVDNKVVEKNITEATKNIKEGATLANSLSNENFLPKMVIGMISAGEASDNLDAMLTNIGNVYEAEIDSAVTGLTSLIEPIIIVIMGFVIGIIVMSVMLPIMNMNTLIQ